MPEITEPQLDDKTSGITDTSAQPETLTGTEDPGAQTQEVVPPGDTATATQSETGEDDEETLPWHKDPRWQADRASRREFEAEKTELERRVAEADALRAELEVLKPLAGFKETFEQWQKEGFKSDAELKAHQQSQAAAESAKLAEAARVKRRDAAIDAEADVKFAYDDNADQEFIDNWKDVKRQSADMAHGRLVDTINKIGADPSYKYADPKVVNSFALKPEDVPIIAKHTHDRAVSIRAEVAQEYETKISELSAAHADEMKRAQAKFDKEKLEYNRHKDATRANGTPEGAGGRPMPATVAPDPKTDPAGFLAWQNAEAKKNARLQLN